MRRQILALMTFLTSSTLLAQHLDIPLTNWTVPPYTRSSGGITTMADISGPRPFIPIQPCRVVDTRGGGVFVVGAYGPPGLVANATRSFDINSATHCPGIPDGADAYSLNFTVVGTAGGPGDLRAWPTGNPPVQTTSVLNWTTANVIIANATIIGAGAGGSIDVTAAGFATHLLIDINGYFGESFGNPENPLVINNSSSQYSIVATNGSTTCTGPCGIRGNTSSTAGAHAVSGYALGATGGNIGVYGETDSSSAGAAGVRGIAPTSTLNPTYGVFGETHSAGAQSAGVYGYATQGGSSGGYFFSLAGANNNFIAFQDTDTDTNYGIFSFAKLRGNSLDIIGGTKNFVSPHPEDPALEIRYVAVEAPTVDVYFRGTATLVNGHARVEVPDHFRFTAREGTYMTELTPVGQPVALSVEEEGPRGIVVRGTGNARFHYVVYAERAEIVGYEPVTKNTSFTPGLIERGGGPGKLPDSTRALLVKNGTLNRDGSYSVETARAQGWTIPEPAPQPEAQRP